MKREEILEQLEKYEKQGFDFFPAWTMDKPITPDRVKIPLGNIFDIREMESLIRIKPSFGDRRHLQIAEGINFYNLLRELSADERYSRYSESFDGAGDLEWCRIRYRNLNFT
jgi:hypothetical protein